MGKFKVVRPIEHNQKLYIPQASTPPERARSVGHGQQIPVDGSGMIELNDKEAKALDNGQIEPIQDSDTKPRK